MNMEELNNIIETIVDTTFEIERANLPRSNFAGIRSKKANVKRTNNLRNNAWKIIKKNDEIEMFIDLNTARYAQYINEDNKYITYGYFDKVSKDAIERITKQIKKRFPKE